jgi:hypothetical protein
MCQSSWLEDIFLKGRNNGFSVPYVMPSTLFMPSSLNKQCTRVTTQTLLTAKGACLLNICFCKKKIMLFRQTTQKVKIFNNIGFFEYAF